MAAKTINSTKNTRRGKPTKSQKLTRRAMERWDDDGGGRAGHTPPPEGLHRAPAAGALHDVVASEFTRN
jgi:hypothetical protein